MRASRSRRFPAVLVILALVGSAAFAAYRWRGTLPSSPPPILGVVHRTEIRLAPDASGRLAALRVKAGQEVRKGDILAVLSNPELTASLGEARASAASARADRANVEAGVRKEEVEIAAQNISIAEANLALARQQHARVATLAVREIASKQQLDETTTTLETAEAGLALAKATYAQSQAGPTKEERAIAAAKVALAEAAVANLEAQLAKTTLVAPLDGVVGILVAEPGEVISPGQPVMTLDVEQERWFTFTLREDRLGGLSIGSQLRLANAKGERIETRVTELRPLGEFAVWRAARAVGDHDVNSFLLRADPIAPARGLEPGMTVWIEPQEGPAQLK